MCDCKWGAIACLTLLPLFVLGGCPINGPFTEGGTGELGLTPFQNTQELVDYVKSRAAHQTNNGVFALSGLEDSATGGEEGGAYTSTNLQVVGVDEADVIKSDGELFYVASGAAVYVVDAEDENGNPVVVSSIALDDQVADLYLLDDELIVLGIQYPQTGSTSWNFPDLAFDGPLYFGGVSTAVTQVDVADPANPIIEKQVVVEGRLITSRVADGVLVLVNTIYPDVPTGLFGAITIGFADIMPTIETSTGAQPLVEVTDWYHPGDPDNFTTTVVVTLAADDVENKIGSLAVMADAGTIYMSPNALYLTDDEYDPRGDGRPTTSIHKIVFADGVPEYQASGAVPGRLLNQFALDEYEGALRVATHIETNTWLGFIEPTFVDVSVNDSIQSQSLSIADPHNGVYVLEEVGNELQISGYVDGIAPNESLYAARFVGDHAYLVTFERIDPLFVLDLGDPTNPEVVGEVELPGFSEYLHPLGDDRLIGVGQAVKENQWGSIVGDGIQLTLFDVSDWNAPSVIQQVKIGESWSYSDTSRTHKGFAFLAEQNRLALPAALYDSDDDWQPSDVVLCYEVDPNVGFTLLGTLDCVTTNDNTWIPWRRGALIGDSLFALTQYGIASTPTDDFSNAKTLVFGE